MRRDSVIAVVIPLLIKLMKKKSYSLSDPDDFRSESKRLAVQAEYWAPSEIAWLSRFVNLSKLKLLDYGCGEGSATSLYANSFVQTLAVDQNKRLLERAKNTYSKITFSVVSDDFEAQLLDFSPDVILLRYVTQHIADEDFEMVDRLFEYAKRQKKCVFIVDADSSDDKIFPANPSFESLVAMGNHYTVSMGGNRKVSEKISEIYRQFSINNDQFHFHRNFRRFDARNLGEFKLLCGGLMNVPRKLGFEAKDQILVDFFQDQNGVFLWAMLFCLIDFGNAS